MYGVAGWGHTPGLKSGTVKVQMRGRGKGVGSGGAFSGRKTGKRSREYQDKRDLKAGRLENL